MMKTYVWEGNLDLKSQYGHFKISKAIVEYLKHDTVSLWGIHSQNYISIGQMINHIFVAFYLFLLHPLHEQQIAPPRLGPYLQNQSDFLQVYISNM